MLGGLTFAASGIGWSRASNDPHHARAVNVARDGFFPTPTPTPTPTPPPPVATRCYTPRESSPFVLRPAPDDSVFRNCQVVAYYGYPGEPVLGVLGQFGSTGALADSLEAVAAAYDAVNGPRHTIPALHIIAGVAQASAGPDGDYMSHIPASVLEPYIALAEEHDWLVILDLQLGHSTMDAEFDFVAPYLLNPRVHLAIDPEWVTPGAPGEVIGSIDAAVVNRAQELLEGLAERNHLANKILIVHQFQRDMITNKQNLAEYPKVDLVIDIDGFGHAAAKQSEYQAFVEEDGAEHGGMKLFYKFDIDLMSPETVVSLVPQPDVVIYQ